MPRHPPCALNNEHTNHHTQQHAMATQVNLTKNKHKEKRNHTNTHNTPHKSAACHTCLMLASTIQFSHNTPTINQHTHCVHQSYGQAPKKGIMPQTPNNAPTYKQILLQNVHGQHLCHKAPFKHLTCLKGVYFTRILQTTLAA